MVCLVKKGIQQQRLLGRPPPVHRGAAHARSAGLGPFGTQAAVVAQIYQAFMTQAAAMSFIDAYMILGVGSAAMFFLSFLLKT